MATLYQEDPGLERRRQLAQAMMAQGQQQTPVRHWTQGANRMAQSLVGAWQNKQAENESQQNRQQFQDNFGSALQSGDMNELAQVLADGGQPGMAAQIMMDQQEANQPEDVGNLGTYNPRDYTVDSWDKFVRERDPSVLERYESQRNVDIGGVPHVFDPSRGGYYPAEVGSRGQQAAQQPSGTQQQPQQQPTRGGGPQQPTRGGTRQITPESVGESQATISQMEAERTPPEGFRLNESGQLEPIPGGPADIEQQQHESEQAAKQRRERALGTIVVQDMDRAENLLDEFGEGFTATQLRSRMADIPGTKAHDLNQLIEASRATVSLQNLQELKETTGAGLGNVSDKQSELLASAYGSIKMSQNKEQLKDSVRRARNIYLDIVFGHGRGPERKPLSFQDEWEPLDEGWVDEQGNPIPTFGGKSERAPEGGGSEVDDLVNQYAD